MEALEKIYLLIENEPTGPYTYFDLLDKLDNGELDETCLSSVVGMPEWRSLKETFVWAQAGILPIENPVLKSNLQALAAGRVDLPTARLETAKAIRACLDTELIGTVLQTNAEFLMALKQDLSSNTPDVLDAFPAAELCMRGRLDYPRDWKSAWENAGGKFFSGRMIARKDSPVWAKVSDFGLPIRPFSFDRAIWVRDIDRAEAVGLGICSDDDIIEPHPCITFRFLGPKRS